MQTPDDSAGQRLPANLMDTLIRLGVLILLLIVCVRIFAPFAGLMVWALVLATALYPVYLLIRKRCGGRDGLSATLLVLAGMLVIGAPLVLLGGLLAGQLQDAHALLQSDEVRIPPPDPAVAEWPLIGEHVHAAWSSAADDLPAMLEKYRPQLAQFSKMLVSSAASTVTGVLKFLVSLIIAGIMLAWARPGSHAILRIICRLTGPERGQRVHTLATATVRSVANGVIGVAFIQAVLLGIGFVWAGIPGAGILTAIVLLIGIAQLPAVLLTLPVIAYLWWSGDSTVWNVIFTVYLLVAGMADGFLKPMLLGRGVEAPMPVILLGALGGMVTGGIIGLFLGAVLLAVGYQLFMEWVSQVDVELETHRQSSGVPTEPGTQ
jgi:predicted PurR-regulated permease PerM